MDPQNSTPQTSADVTLEVAHRAQIQKHGFTFQRALHDAEGGLYRHYTIGLAETYGWPELVVIGTMHDASAQNMLRSVIYTWQDAKGPSMTNIKPSPDHNFQLALRHLDREEGVAHTKLVARFKGDADYKVVQVVWSDGDGVLPDSELHQKQYADTPSMAQPMLMAAQ